MISVIMPLVQRQRHWIFWLVRGIIYLLASMAGGALLGALLGAGGALLRGILPFAVIAGAALVLALAYGLHELGVLRLPHPEMAWQVPNRWILRRPLLGAAAFGALLGAGIFTYIPFTAFYLLLAWEVLLANPWAGALLGAIYGATRALPALIGGAMTARDGAIVGAHVSILGAAPRIHRVAGALLLMAAGLAVLPLLAGGIHP
ncbi:MAG TPA: hypothetical protein VM536_06715 [Chloroflexia bacterium]|nr:hypothetical protein [Chloroflexia bacterium]